MSLKSSVDVLAKETSNHAKDSFESVTNFELTLMLCNVLSLVSPYLIHLILNGVVAVQTLISRVPTNAPTPANIKISQLLPINVVPNVDLQ